MPQRPLPYCKQADCFAWRNGKCKALTVALEPCGFHKTEPELGMQLNRGYERLTALGYSVDKQFPGYWGIFTKEHRRWRKKRNE